MKHRRNCQFFKCDSRYYQQFSNEYVLNLHICMRSFLIWFLFIVFFCVVASQHKKNCQRMTIAWMSVTLLMIISWKWTHALTWNAWSIPPSSMPFSLIFLAVKQSLLLMKDLILRVWECSQERITISITLLLLLQWKSIYSPPLPFSRNSNDILPLNSFIYGLSLNNLVEQLSSLFYPFSPSLCTSLFSLS